MNETKFAIYIISHNRPECETYYKLRNMGFTGNIEIIIDDTDNYIKEYEQRFDNQIRIFNKDDVDIDLMDNFDGPKGIATYSREYCMELAKKEGLDYILMLDDDLKDIKYRINKSDSYKITNLDYVFEKCLQFMTNGIDILTFGTSNDYIGGKSEEFKIGRGTNAYLINVNSNIHFKGRYSEDRIMPILYSKIGKVIFKILRIQFVFDVWQPNKKARKGGCNEIYDKKNNYAMMFYPVISSPDSTFSKYNNKQYVASTNYRNVCPKIISGRYKK